MMANIIRLRCEAYSLQHLDPAFARAVALLYIADINKHDHSSFHNYHHLNKCSCVHYSINFTKVNMKTEKIRVNRRVL